MAAIRNQLDDLIALARRDGWATGICSVQKLELQTWGRPYATVAGRSRTGGFEELRPTDPELAEKHSLSAIYGRGEQPLHTDGAHLTEPPDIVILAAAEPTPVPTLLWHHQAVAKDAFELEEDLRNGLFAVDDGKEAFLAPAQTGWARASSRIRFDPGCMTPVDSRARRVSAHFTKTIRTSTTFEWTQQHQVLVIDNRNVLHARAAAADDPDRSMQRLMLRIKQEGSL